MPGPKNLAAWTPILKDYSPGLLATCDHAATRATQIVATALERYMLAGAEDPAKSAGEAAEWFGNAAEFLSHGRPVRRDEAREHGIIVNDLEDNGELQDLVLSVHHTAMLTLSRTGTTKLVESHRGRAWVNQVQQVQQMIAIPGPARPPALGGPAGPVPVPPKRVSKERAGPPVNDSRVLSTYDMAEREERSGVVTHVIQNRRPGKHQQHLVPRL